MEAGGWVRLVCGRVCLVLPVSKDDFGAVFDLDALHLDEGFAGREGGGYVRMSVFGEDGAGSRDGASERSRGLEKSCYCWI